MLRKDVKLGLAVGGVLLAVLVLYVLVVPGNQQPAGEDLAQGDASGDVTTDAVATEGSPANPTPAAPVASNAIVDPFANSSLTTVASNEPLDRRANGWDWAKLLDGEAPALMSQSSPARLAPVASGTTTTSSSSNLVLSEIVPVSQDQATALPSTAAGPRQHVIQPNETLSSIAKDVYGSSKYYTHILRANPNLDDRKLKIGQTIVLPDVTQVRPPSVAAVTPSAVGSDEYRVQANDSLYTISLKLYGKGNRVDELYELNRQTIGENPNRLKAGMVLKLPQGGSPSAAASVQ